MNSDDISTLTEDELSYNSDENNDENSQNEESNLDNINLFDSMLYNDFSIYNQSYPEFSYFNNFINSSQINIPNLSNLPNSSQINIPNLSNLPGSNFLHNTPINSLNPSFSTNNLNTNLSLNSSNNFFNNMENVTEHSISDDINTDYNNEYESLLPLSSVSELVSYDNQYTLLNDSEDANNPFFKCKIDDFNYDTDDEENESLRIILSWNYEFNYDYFNIVDLNICISKDEYFKSILNKFKTKKPNTINKILKIDNEIIKKNDQVYLYLIIFYDNAKINIDFYGIFNQLLNNDKLLENIKNENMFGKKGIVCNETYSNNLIENDFIVLCKKLKII
jgi:hypothetical protein